MLNHLIAKTEYLDFMQRIALQGLDDFNKQPEPDDLEGQKAGRLQGVVAFPGSRL